MTEAQRLAQALRDIISADIYTDAPECQDSVLAAHLDLENAASYLDGLSK